MLERDAAGVPSKVRATLHIATGPFVKDFNLTLALTEPAPGTIKLARQQHGPGDHERFEVTWVVTAGAGAGAAVALTFDANLSVRASSRSTASPTESPAASSTPPPASSDADQTSAVRPASRSSR